MRDVFGFLIHEFPLAEAPRNKSTEAPRTDITTVFDVQSKTAAVLTGWDGLIKQDDYFRNHVYGVQNIEHDGYIYQAPIANDGAPLFDASIRYNIIDNYGDPILDNYGDPILDNYFE